MVIVHVRDDAFRLGGDVVRSCGGHDVCLFFGMMEVDGVQMEEAWIEDSSKLVERMYCAFYLQYAAQFWEHRKKVTARPFLLVETLSVPMLYSTRD